MDKAKMILKIDELCKKYDRKDYPGMAIAVIDNGEVIFKNGYGEASLDYNIPITENTVFHACSITKQFTAACIAMLLQEGKLSLYQHITDIFPQLNECYKDVTVYNLVYMTNGIPDVYDTAALVGGVREDEGITRDEFWKYASSFDWLLFKPGEKWEYGNTGYFLLGQIVEKVTGMSLSQYADEHIFKPLGMKHTFIRDDHTKIIRNRAVGYSPYDYVHFNHSNKCYTSRNDKISINQENVEVGGAGQLWTTINDFLLWNKNFYNNILGCDKDKLIKLTTTSGLLANGKECGYGFGLFFGDFYGNRVIFHGGCAGGYSAHYTQIPGKKISVILFGNDSDFCNDFALYCNGLTDKILRLLLGIKEEEDNNQDDNNLSHGNVAKKESIAKLGDSELKKYEGNYSCEKINASYSVRVYDGNLLIKNENLRNNGMDLEYRYLKDDTFRCTPNKHKDDLFVRFMRNSDNEVASFIYENNTNNKFLFLKSK